MDTTKIIFLDIDGVLQPGTQYRHEHISTIDELYKELYERFGIDYSAYDNYDVAAVYYDWDKKAVAELQRILDETSAAIVISSDWRQSKEIHILKDFFRIYGMADYVIDYTPVFSYSDIKEFQKTKYPEIHEWRAIEIMEYLEVHPEIKRWVAIDDLPLYHYLPDNAVYTSWNLQPEDADKCIAILNS